jgi:hypothetical protein
MNKTLIEAVFVVWLPVVVALFRVLGPRQAGLIGVFGGFLFLPRETLPLSIFETLSINKRVVSGLALLLGVLVFDPRALIRGRPRLVDLPMIGFVLLPLISLATNQFQGYLITIDQVWRNALEWAMPYLVGRLYFGDREAPRDLTVAIVISGLVYVPVCIFEMLLGPKYYLLGLIYGIPAYGHMVARLGGWRPEGFLTNGIELTTWMALASTSAVWLWLRRGWTPWRAPSWSPALALTLVTVACRGVYGYLGLAIGLPTAVFSNLLKTRVLIAILAFLPPLYVGVRASGLWDGGSLVELAKRTGRGDTVAYRLLAEDAYLKKVLGYGPWFGFGGTDSGIFDWFSQAQIWPDGWWIHQVRAGGLVGLTGFFLALFLVPVGLGLALPAGRSGRASPGALAWGLALFLVLHMIDSLQNMAYLTPTTLIGGSLTALFLGRRSSRLDVPYIAQTASSAEAPPRTSVLVTIAVLIAFEILGSLPRTPPLDPSTPPGPDGPPAK